MTTSIVLIHSDSRESINKAIQLADAARKLGLSVLFLTPVHSNCKNISSTESKRYLPENPQTLKFATMGRDVKAVISCSDGVTLDSVFAAGFLGLNGREKVNLKAFISKAAQYELLQSLGVDVLPYFVPMTFSELYACDIQGPIFVKPDWSSGVSTQVPWEYKRYEDLADFANFLVENNHIDQFEANPSLIMEYVPHDGMYTVSATMTATKSQVHGRSFVKVSDGSWFYEYADFLRGKKLDQLEQAISGLWEAGFQNHVVYIQCLEKDGKIYPIDLNTRFSTYLDSLASARDQGFYERFLGFILGEGHDLELRLATHDTLIGRLACDPYKSVTDLVLPEVQGVELLFSGKGESSAFYDKAYSWPTIICEGDQFLSSVDKYEIIKTQAFLKQ